MHEKSARSSADVVTTGAEAESNACRDGATMAIIVVNFRSHRLLADNLAPIEWGEIPVEVVIVDNFSSQDEYAAVSELCGAQGWHLVALPDNRGFGAAVNAGVRRARALGVSCYLLLNPDATVTPEVVAELRRSSLEQPMALISPRIMSSSGAVFFDGSRVFLDSGRIRGTACAAAAGSLPARRRPVPTGESEEWVSGACLVVHDQLLQRVGPLDESYFLYWEDLDLSHRCLAAGGTLVVRRDLLAVHDAGGTQESPSGTGKSTLYYRYNCRNRLGFAARHLPRRRILRWIRSTPSVTWEILLRGGRRELVRHPGLAIAALVGSAAGLAVALMALFGARPSGVPPRAGSVLVVHPGAELYGSDRMVAESVRGLVDSGVRVVVVLPAPGPLVRELEEAGAEVRFQRMPVVRKSSLTARGLVLLVRDAVVGLVPMWRLLRREGGAGVYVSTVIVPLTVALARLAGRRVVLHVHEAEQGAPRIVRGLLGAPALLAHRVVFNSRYSQDVLCRSVPLSRHRSVVVYNGVAGPLTSAPARTELSGPVRLAYVGRLSPRKGPQVAIAALAELVRRGVDAHLTLAGSVFAGNEDFGRRLEEQVRAEGLADRVEFRGFVSDVFDFLGSADVALIPSVLDEPFGNTAVEAVLSARPVVLSWSSGLREAGAGYDSVLPARPGDVHNWATAIERVIAGWPRLSVQAAADAAEARRRHDPARYRTRMAALIVGERTA
ncbi:MAG: hypothetical protein JWO67_2881 [Streptosporangiaceae bacterium]|nr:hypothetical protein [Streptosporangiaceae bacterium]